MMAAGLLAKKAVEKGLTRKPWVKTTLAPGSQVVTDYYNKSGLTQYLDALGFNFSFKHLEMNLDLGDNNTDPVFLLPAQGR